MVGANEDLLLDAYGYFWRSVFLSFMALPVAFVAGGIGLEVVLSNFLVNQVIVFSLLSIGILIWTVGLYAT